MSTLQTLLTEAFQISELKKSYDKGEQPQLVTGLSGGAKTAYLHALYETFERPIVVVSPNLLQAQRLYEDIDRWDDSIPVSLYPAEELIAADSAIASPELRASRIETLHKLSTKQPGIYVIPIAAFRKLMPSVEQWQASQLFARIGEELNIDKWLIQLVELGYNRQGMVTTPGEFAVRGGIIDIFPIYAENPIRIELFDTEIDSIRTFSADDQRSLERLEEIHILPATEQLWYREQLEQLTPALQKALATSLKKLKQNETKELLHATIQSEIERLESGIPPERLSLYRSLLPESPTMLTDYIDPTALVVFDEIGRIQESTTALENEEMEWILSMMEEGKMLHDSKVSFSWKEIIHSIDQDQIFLSLFSRALSGLGIKKSVAISCKPMQHFHGQMNLLKNEAERWISGQFRVFILAESAERIEKVQSVLRDYEMTATIANDTTTFQQPGIYLISGTFSNGFELPLQQIAVITDEELFKQKTKKKARPQKMTNAERIKSYTEIKPGDYVVHVHHGIGKYIGIETLDVGGLHKDYLHIRYRADDKLYVPVEQIDQIQKYVASEDKEPKLHKLGSADWKKTKTRVSKAVQDIADDLIKLYAKREAEKGYAFSPDDDEQQLFESAFPYEETDDQLRTITEVKRDMERERPMDRLVCGDVGYGKTEVAIRAAFKAIMDGKQVAFLVPTTILAQQHYETFIERFKDFPITVGLLSRFRTKKQQQETIAGLNKGTVDIVIGTHRILSKDVAYHDLGLLVIDEEQRFGVTHKEKIKQLKTNVDVLTLTATPIPRTLHMSMIGVRDLSVIETPPANRYPVQTYVMEHNFALVREAIERELARDGQVFYLYNRVEDMVRKVEELQDLVPDARIAYAHGQMSESELESIILSFLEGEFDVLVTTTIIETGIDIPNVNTLIVHDADRMGLSQLYQLRGRVGRSNRVAYAYFMYQRDKVLTDVAEKRLQAIKEFTELGSGFKIAMRDLSIRGTGNLLGAQQHGFIDSVGFDLYAQMLQDAIEERQTGVKKEETIDVEIQLPYEAYLPDSYVPDGYQKIQMYKRIKNMDEENEYEDLVDELVDRFGDLPNEAENLLKIARMKVWAKQAGVESIKTANHKIVVQLSQAGTAKLNGAAIVEASMPYGHMVGFKMDPNQRFVMTIDTKSRVKHHPFDVLEEMMRQLPKTMKQEAAASGE